MIHIDFPFHLDGLGRTALVAADQHIRDMIELFLFTNPGERVNRPDFGSGLLAMVFNPNSEEEAGALEQTVQAGLVRWLGDLIEVEEVTVTAEQAVLYTEIRYTVRSTGDSHTDTFTTDGG